MISVLLSGATAALNPYDLTQARLPAGEEKNFELGNKVKMLAKPGQDPPGVWQLRKVVKKPVNGSQVAVSACHPCPATRQTPCFIKHVHQASIQTQYNYGTKLSQEMRLLLSKAPKTEFLASRKPNKTHLSKFPISPGTSMKLVFIPKLECYTAILRVKRKEYLIRFVLHEHHIYENPTNPFKSAPGYFELAPC
ncbi:hypothetical protein DSO57_1036792 [Entomophthora muscae]|uniref:Uncharacterized protein n=1 Tax=Entomophthora muscae TaxID=34485 RepID=A0ACC2SC54_9FUNG|nr:hypothetical protein DSO57_1036792 [Entomophthora muscae]